ncbi:hypothetical protein [Paenibacillus sp. R14(2021)]|uniref:hypothetical protein n=1 Tax=Paenibacillus sp. R14(2021) TaxID=2859228 RepID=UPI001C615160|nr:hypothetical protein [Paenibacillus sp. R14(2021)]
MSNIKGKRKLGKGHYRQVFNFSNTSVLKLAVSKKGIRSNRNEVKVYKHARKKNRKYLGKIKKYGKNYTWILMKKYRSRAKNTEANQIRLKRIIKKLRRNNIKPMDIVARNGKIKRGNVAIYKKRLVIIDYGKFKIRKKK